MTPSSLKRSINHYILATGLTTTLLESKLYYHQHRSESAYAWARNEAIILLIVAKYTSNAVKILGHKN